MDPRLRSRRVAVQRELGRRRLHRVLVVASAVAILAGIVGVVLSPLLDVDRVALEGVPAGHLVEVHQVIGVSSGDPLLLVDTGAVTERLEARPWVERAEVTRSLPGTLRVMVVPRVSVGWTRAPDSIQLIGAGGRVLATAAEPPAGLPELAPPTSGATPGVLRAEALVAAALPATLRARVAAVVVDRGTGALRLVSGPEIRLGELRDLRAKARAAEALLGALRGAGARYVDVQVASAPVVG